MTNIVKFNEAFFTALNIELGSPLSDIELKKTAQWDSISHLNLIIALEDSFDIFFDAEDVLDFTSYKKGIEIMQKYNVDLKA